MKRIVFVGVFFAAALSVFGQRLSTVGILPFEISGGGVNSAEAAEAAGRIARELASWGTMTVLEGEAAKGAEYLVRGQISRQNNEIVITASVAEARTGRTLNTAKEQASALTAIPMEAFCARIAENIPFPNYLLGKWRSTLNMVDGPVTCVLEFLSDRTVRVEQFDTWEHNGKDSLKYQGIGKGTYSYAGYLRRTVSLGGRQIEADATIGISLTLEDALPKYTTLNSGGLRVLFNESKSAFDLVYGGIPCGDNYSGPSVYPGTNVYYTRFTKIQ